MAHIPDGVLSAPVLIGAAAATAVGVAIALKRLDSDRIPQTAVLTAVFFVASLVHIPIGPTSVHPLLSGLMGLVLGWAAVPAVLVGLVLQAAFFGFGGITVLGVNTFNIALPALVIAAVIGPLLQTAVNPTRVALLGALAGAAGVVLTAVLVCLSLGFSAQEYRPALTIVLASYAPLAAVEAVLTAAAVSLLRRVKPELLSVGEARHA
ncbi:Cobalamin biosynthesis protein CbiM [Candidatus Defluviicoccus seviourii]|uniref:Cobalamin biosynthesis protein CbiM n=2 Tax=root TaxID=1 RepID=A0A564W969_9PROT|nr:Cobalamin biosynthesis protein CbiM [uncultured Defluviicoccus sp.]VUX44980.1 Cobalamin biosynthesis protein CbiM [Candidatus Defluviicoccus seviourii]